MEQRRYENWKRLAHLLVVLNILSPVAAQPMTRTKIDGINVCEFVSKDIIAYTTSSGSVTLCNARDFKPITTTTCDDVFAWLAGSGKETIIVQTSRNVLGFSSKTLQREFEVKNQHRILMTALSLKKELLAVYDISGSVATYSLLNRKQKKLFLLASRLMHKHG